MSAKPEEIAPATGSVAGKSLYLIPFTLLILIVVNRVKVWWRLRHFKGPWLASISSFPAAKYATSGKMWWHYTEVNKKYGDLARIGSNDLICSDPEVIRYMSSARSGWHRSDWYDSMSLDPYCNNVINTKDPVAHDKMRTKLVQGYAGKENPTLEADIDKQVASLVSLIKRKYIFSPASNPTYIDFGKAAQYFTLDVITALGFGFPFGYLERDEDVHEYVKTTETVIPVLVLSCCYPLMNKILGHPWVRAITGPHTEDKVGLGKLMGVAREVVGERFGPEAKEKRDMLGSFIRHGLPRREAESEVLLQLAAGSDTTATAVRATLLHLLTTPGALFKLREEIDAGIREGRISSPITNVEARELSYLQAVIKEGLRMQPPFIGLLAKEVPPQGEVIKGKFVPGGTKIGHSIYAAERSEEVFGKDADAFRPERWLEEPDEQKLRLMEDTQQLVFGYGRWGCLGKSIALVELNKVFVEIPVLSADSNDVDTGLQGTQHWINVHIRTNLFSSTEVPPIDPLPLRANSIGEEISLSDTASIEWSPPGLAKHSRCALAVLTTNLNLSLWVSDSDPKVTRSWKRALVLNHEVERYFQKVYAQEEFRLDLDWETRRRLRRRIRSFAWSPQLRPSLPAEHSVQEGQFPVNCSFIAVSNDNNDVAILRVDSPYSFFSPPSAQWSARAEAHFSLEPKLDLHPVPRPFLLTETMSEQRYIGNLAWSPWTTDPHGVPEAILAYTTNHSIHLRRVRIAPFSSDVSLDQTDIFSDPSIGTRNVHLLRWMPRAHDDVFYLVAFSQAGAFCYEVPCRDPSKTTATTHDLDKRWDTIAASYLTTKSVKIGCAFNGLSKTEPGVQFISQLTAPVVATSEFKLPIPPTTESQAPPFQQSIRDSEKLFSAENELAGHTHTKAWAMCSSPMGDLVASGVSFHPGDMVEYTIAATSRTHIGVQPFHDTADLSAETLIYCAQTWLEELPEESRAEHSVRSTILEQFWRALGLSNEHGDGLVAQYPKVNVDGLNLEERTSLAQALRRAVYSNDKSILKQRYGRLLTLFFDPKGTTQSDDAPAIQKLVTEVLRVPKSSYNDSEASRKIRTVYSSMLPWLSDAEASGMYDGAVETSTDKHVERCEICDDSIGFESFAWARCGQGHEFGEFTKEQGIVNLGSSRLMRVPAVRCSLTFLAIQAPGISKLCGICGKRYLNEESVVRTDKLAGADTSQQDVAMPDVDGGQQGDNLPWAETNVTSEGSSKQGAGTGQGQAATVDCGRSPITLARMLFAACDVCIYCGGKFVG
ncbi:hypothetical protein SLS58_003325 [Diplodia intermedia]|uniref:Cytochrome p450 n=1 Tax=Diplodia intermedia TaxID=856260 RepID=A0ABR3TWM1_9PEZI